VVSSEPFIPWELVHLKEPGQPLPAKPWFLAQLGLVRWLYCGDGAYPPQTLHARDGRVLALVPDYADPGLRLAHAAGELQFLTGRLGARVLTPHEHPVREALRAGGFDVLHFAGHGLADGADIANAKILLEGRFEQGGHIRTYLSATTVEQQARPADVAGGDPGPGEGPPRRRRDLAGVRRLRAPAGDAERHGSRAALKSEVAPAGRRVWMPSWRRRRRPSSSRARRSATCTP
jgi:hypothetical protein